MVHKVEITNLHKNSITYLERRKHKRKIKAYSFLILLLPILAIVCLRFYSGNNINDIYMNVCNLYNPIYSPYSETGSITFAGYTFVDNIEDFELPIVSSDIDIDDNGTVIAKIKESILVKSIADGVVERIYEQDGVNIVRILYGKDIAAEYHNIDVLGVNVGNIVEKGKEIGTAKIGDSIKLKIYLSDKQVKGLKIENNKIVWQS